MVRNWKMDWSRIGACNDGYDFREESAITIEDEPRSAGARRSAKPKIPWPEDRNFNILCIDGGGIKGILPAAVLAGLEKQLPAATALADYFDLIAGTSTGGIISLAIGVGKSAQEALDLYVNRGNEIFPPSRFPKLRFVVSGFRKPVFDREGLDNILRDEFGERGFWETKTRMCIPAVEGKFGEVHIYKTPHHPDYKKDWLRSAFEVARATSAAPVYLEAVKQSGYVLVDGGLFANDPIMVAIIDVLSCYAVPPEKIRVLSLGCLKESWNLEEVQNLGRGWLSWTLRAYEVTGSLQSQNAQGQAGLLVGPENVLRVDAPQPSHRINLDDWIRARNELPSVADSLVKRILERAQRMFFQRSVDTYIPVYDPQHPPD